MPGHVLGAQVPLLDWWFLAQGTGFMEDSFSMDGEWADSLGRTVGVEMPKERAVLRLKGYDVTPQHIAKCWQMIDNHYYY